MQGNYDVFEKTMRERVRNAKAAAESQEMKRKHMQASRVRPARFARFAHPLAAFLLAELLCFGSCGGGWLVEQVPGGAAQACAGKGRAVLFSAPLSRPAAAPGDRHRTPQPSRAPRSFRCFPLPADRRTEL